MGYLDKNGLIKLWSVIKTKLNTKQDKITTEEDVSYVDKLVGVNPTTGKIISLDKNKAGFIPTIGTFSESDIDGIDLTINNDIRSVNVKCSPGITPCGMSITNRINDNTSHIGIDDSTGINISNTVESGDSEVVVSGEYGIGIRSTSGITIGSGSTELCIINRDESVTVSLSTNNIEIGGESLTINTTTSNVIGTLTVNDEPVMTASGVQAMIDEAIASSVTAALNKAY